MRSRCPGATGAGPKPTTGATGPTRYTRTEPNLAAHALVAVFAHLPVLVGRAPGVEGAGQPGHRRLCRHGGWFYFSDIFDKVGRSLGLIGLGVLFLAGGWALKRCDGESWRAWISASSTTAGGEMKISISAISRPRAALFSSSWQSFPLSRPSIFISAATCPRVWARTVAIDPEMPMRGRYLSLQLTVDGCQSTLPSAKAAAFPRDINGAAIRGPYRVRASVDLPCRSEGPEQPPAGHPHSGRSEWRPWAAGFSRGRARPATPCASIRRSISTLPSTRQSPLPLKPGQELWIEVTVPPKGPPGPSQLALKDNSDWTPLAFQ